ncbi:MAG: ABC transporter permease [Spirochaetales bacterium]|nr:ABC transporter permease [Spirochaetales bacterium]
MSSSPFSSGDFLDKLVTEIYLGPMASEWKAVRSTLIRTWGDFFRALAVGPFPWRETGRQFVRVINDGWVTVVAGSVVQGIFVMWLAGYYGKMFGAYIWVGSVTAYAVFREFAVLMTSVLFAGRIGTAFTVEIGSMQMSEQIAAMSLMNVDPQLYLTVPRVVASLIALPIFTAFSFGIAILSSWLLMAFFWDMSAQIFFQNAFMFTPATLLTNSLIRAFVIGFTVALNAVALGFHRCAGAEDLGRSTTKSIVLNLFSVLLIDLLLGILFTTLSSGLRG